MKATSRLQPLTVTVHVPMRFTTRSNSKRIISASAESLKPRFENALIKALARAHRFRRLIETGAYASITELATAEKVNQSYACRLLRLTLLSPSLVLAILDGRLNSAPTICELMKPFPLGWTDQARKFKVEN